MKKIGALIMCMTVWGAALYAQTGATSAADFDTKAAGNGVVIAKYKGAGGAVVIPATIGGKTVVGIGEMAFSSNKSLASVTIPAGVTSISEGAFYGCISLKPETIADIEKRFGKDPFNPLGFNLWGYNSPPLAAVIKGIEI